MKTLFLTISASFMLLSGFSQHSIGHTTKTFVDASRGNRDIETEIYYPATTAGDDTPSATGEFPVIVFGHGFVMAWDVYNNLWEEFVPRGYIMVFPRTEGNIASTDHQKFGWDLQYLVTEMQNEGATGSSILFNHVASETALMGHSMGGGASFLAADSLVTNGNTNLKTIVGLAPAESTTNGVSSIASAAQITVPSLILSGTKDGVTPPADHHIPMYNALASSCKTILNVIDGGHCGFANSSFTCDFGESTSSPGGRITRPEQHQITFEFVNLWLDYTLKNDCGAFTDFQNAVTNSTEVTNSQTCSIVIPTIDITVAQTATQLSSNENGATAYQWLDCGNNNSPITNETNQTFNPSSDGSYAVEITVNGCKDISNCINFSNSVGIEKIDFINFQLYPNPAKDKFSIKTDFTGNYSVVISDLNGKSVLQKNKVKNGTEVNINNIETGTYFITFSSENESIIKKLIKQ